MRAPLTRTIAAGSVLLAALSLTACTAQPTAAPTPNASSSPSDASAAAPTMGPIDEEALTALFEKTAAELGQPGAVMLLRSPAGEFTATYGVTSPGGSTPVSVDDHIRVGSNTKTWTGTVILQLMQEGTIALDDPVSMYRPDVPNGENITIEELLMMRSGLANYTETYELNAALDADPQRVWQPEELVAMGLALPPDFEPGTAFHYSNTNTVLLGLIAEQLDGKPLGQIFEDRLFTPLGLDDTSFPELADSSLPAPYSDGYYWWTNVGTLGSSKLPPDLLAGAEDGSFAPSDGTLDNPSWAWAAGAGISTATDLADWAEALGGKTGGLLDPELQQQRLDSAMPTDPDDPASAAYGWNIAKVGSFYGHTGELPGFNSFMAYDPVDDVTLVVWANLAPAADGRGPAATIAQALIRSLY
ncbi:serine hydrolase domain-containing protein [Herbiconiux sp. KACC 21604]|uniref:serine hydrolase domain-containing protein n=1 Tax=unclassified Herbiconiux TaxID=2618217 RepID=UPI00149268DC|nr:serine hydrolase domain-containing protein [Herbiconiux sp. SALV-R1]QJU53387.1 beta-lactamase family protein [Herbiconiux sp. SALV-R1]WPO88351.1 serine hydrolase domain-containing protein [Herbiconiux sp. KACC 21604]